MALLTPLPTTDAEAILREYGLELLQISPLAAGSVNSNFFLEARHQVGGSRARYFARLYEEQDEAGAHFEVQVNRHLLTAGLPVARPVMCLSGESTRMYHGKPFALYQRLEGEVLCQSRVTPRVARSVGSALAGVHQAELGELGLPAGRFGFADMLERAARVEGSGREDLLPAARRVRDLVGELQARRLGALPGGLIHGDLFRDNVLVLDEEVSGLLDFESACRGPYVYDLMVTSMAWCYGNEFEETLLRALFEGYQSVRPLDASERSALVTEGSIACVRFVSTRLTDFSLRVAPHASPARHYGRFFDRLAALQAGVVQRALRGLI